MKKPLALLIIFLTIYSLAAFAQKAHFEAVNSGITAVPSHDTLIVTYYTTFHGANASDSFTGTIYTNIYTLKNTTPTRTLDSIKISPGSALRDKQSMNITARLKITGNYFSNDSNNVVVIWPTGARSSGQTIDASDTIKAPKKITVTTLGVAGSKSGFNPLKIYPNPAGNYLNVELEYPDLKDFSIKIMDISGRVALTTNKAADKLDISALKPGTYFIEVCTTDNHTATYSFMISK